MAYVAGILDCRAVQADKLIIGIACHLVRIHRTAGFTSHPFAVKTSPLTPSIHAGRAAQILVRCIAECRRWASRVKRHTADLAVHQRCREEARFAACTAERGVALVIEIGFLLRCHWIQFSPGSVLKQFRRSSISNILYCFNEIPVEKREFAWLKPRLLEALVPCLSSWSSAHIMVPPRQYRLANFLLRSIVSPSS